MRINTFINKTDDVQVTLSIEQLRVILSEIDGLKRTMAKEEDEWATAQRRDIKEYGRTGKIAEFDQTLADESLDGHSADCSVWEGDELCGLKCSCGRWSDD